MHLPVLSPSIWQSVVEILFQHVPACVMQVIQSCEIETQAASWSISQSLPPDT